MPDILSPRDILDRLVSFPTVSRDSNLELIDWVRNYLEGFGVSSDLVFDPTGRKAGLFAQIGPSVPGGIILSAHTDVVPVDGQEWASDPWTVTERGGKLYGRGTCDMKGFIAAVLANVPSIVEAKIARPVQIALTRDEEIGCLGAPPLIKEMQEALPPASAVIVGEPTMMTVVTGHKGTLGYQVHCRGHEVHSSILHTGVSAVMSAAQIIDWGNRMNNENFNSESSGYATMFDPPCTTVHAGLIEGGTAMNITARDCRFCIDFRFLPSESADSLDALFREFVAEVESACQKVRRNAWIRTEEIFRVPAMAPEPKGEAERLARALTGDNGTRAVSYATEGGQFQEAGNSVVVCGPGSIAQAHGADEFISSEQLEAGSRFVRRLVESLSKRGM
ncbi:MAG: acetylornithine deacetylase [Albidovulum sp.]|nr:acetylornithine deacetylase [Albidovulum sp.]